MEEQRYCTLHGAGMVDVDIFILDTEYLCMSYLDGYTTEVIAKTGDSEKRRVLVDWCLTVKNPAAHALFTDVDDDVAWQA